MPKISIIMPVYNGHEYLSTSINSVLNQTYTDFELICVNDASTDNSEEIILHFHKQDSRVCCYSKENQGPGEALNYGIKKARGDYLCFLDQDDKYAENYLELMLKSIESSGCEMSICQAYYWEREYLKKIPYPSFKSEIVKTNNKKTLKFLLKDYFPQWTKIIKKEFFQKYNIFFPSKEYKAHDEHVHYQLIALCEKIGFVQECIYYHRVHRDQITQTIKVDLCHLQTLNDFFHWMDKNPKIKGRMRTVKLTKVAFKIAARSTNNIAILDRLLALVKKNLTPIHSFDVIYRIKKIKKSIKNESFKNVDSLSLPKPYLVNLGKNSYCAAQPVIVSPNTCIGCFCSLGENIRIGHGEHPLNYLSTSPYFYYDSLGWKHKDTISHNEFWYYPPVQIGNDVWIGDNVLIKNGLHIGDGAVIGMGAVVTKDVPPYAIVAGNPAKIIRYRFNEQTIQKLLKLKWWNMDDEILKKLPYDDIDDVISKLINVG